jgi:hypothetical protein
VVYLDFGKDIDMSETIKMLDGLDKLVQSVIGLCQKEIDSLEAQNLALKRALENLLREPLEVADKGPIGGRFYVFRVSLEKYKEAEQALKD